VIDAAGGCLEICGEVITTTETNEEVMQIRLLRRFVFLRAATRSCSLPGSLRQWL
jgi:hypothetical protein